MRKQGTYLAKRRDKSRLSQRQGARTHRRGKGIGNVICTNVEGIDKGKDDAQGKNIRVLCQDGHTENTDCPVPLAKRVPLVGAESRSRYGRGSRSYAMQEQHLLTGGGGGGREKLWCRGSWEEGGERGGQR
jgi:hypothetical protein